MKGGAAADAARFAHLDAFVLGAAPENSRNEDYIAFLKLLLETDGETRMSYIVKMYREPERHQKVLCCTCAAMLLGIPTYLAPGRRLAPLYNGMSQQLGEIFLTDEMNTERTVQARVFDKLIGGDSPEYNELMLCATMIRDIDDDTVHPDVKAQVDSFAREMMVASNPRKAYNTRRQLAFQKLRMLDPEAADQEDALMEAALERAMEGGEVGGLMAHLRELLDDSE